MLNTNTLKIVKSLKLSFDSLGYAVCGGSIVTDRQLYRKMLRSGKQESQKCTTNDRNYQILTFYKCFFKSDSNPLLRCYYKAMINYLLSDNDRVNSKYMKHAINVSKQVLKRGFVEVFILPDGKLLKDKVNNKDFYFSNSTRKIYRLVNGKAIIYKV